MWEWIRNNCNNWECLGEQKTWEDMIGVFTYLKDSDTKDGDILSAAPQRQMERTYEETIGKLFVQSCM